MNTNKSSIRLSFFADNGYKIKPAQKVILQDEFTRPLGDGEIESVYEDQADIISSELATVFASDFITNGIPSKVLATLIRHKKLMALAPVHIIMKTSITKVVVFIAGGGIGGRSLFRYFSEAGKSASSR